MKKFIVFTFGLFLSLSLFSQSISHIEFAYDAAGNRTTREVIYLKSTTADNPQELKESSMQQVTDSVEFKGTLGSREVSIFPNPTKRILTIAMASWENDGSVRLELFSLSGEIILQQEIRHTKTTVDLSTQPPGTYLLKISSAAGQQSWKIIKE